MNTVTRLALRNIRAKKYRTAVIIAAVVLTILLFSVVVSTAVNMFSVYGETMKLYAGTDLHGYVRARCFSADTGELTKRMLGVDHVKRVEPLLSCGSFTVDGNDTENVLVAVKDADSLEHFYCGLTEGRFPEDGEIIVDPEVFPDVKVGDELEIRLNVIPDGNSGSVIGRTERIVYGVSGFFTCRADHPIRALTKYSAKLEDSFIQRPNLYVGFDNSINVTGKYDKLVESLAEFRISDGIVGTVSPAYTAGVGELVNPASAAAVVIAFAVIFLCAFLLIGNIYSIALVRDMRDYGLLSVVGMSRSQIKKLIVTGASVIFAVAALPGLVLGYFVGWKIMAPIFSGAIFSSLEFSPRPGIFVLTLVFSYLTLIFSALFPLSKLKKLTPIGAVDYTPQNDLPKRFIRKKNAAKPVTPDIFSLSRWSVSRNRRRTVITALSVSMSVTLFLLTGLTADYIAALAEAHTPRFDYTLQITENFRVAGVAGVDGVQTTLARIDSGVSLPDSLVSRIEGLGNVAECHKVRVELKKLSLPDRKLSEFREMSDESAWFGMSRILSEALCGEVEAVIVSLPDECFNEIQFGRETVGEYQPGTIIYDSSTLNGVTDGGGNRLGLSYFDDGEEITLGGESFRIISLPRDPVYPTYQLTRILMTTLYRAVFYLPESEFLARFGEGTNVELLIDAADDQYEALGAELKSVIADAAVGVDDEPRSKGDYVGGYGYEVISNSFRLTGRLDGYTAMVERANLMRVGGIGLSALIFLVGILNIINSSVTSVAGRKNELGTLGAVGMTGRQMKIELVMEGIAGSTVAVIVSLAVGVLPIVFISERAMGGLARPDWLAGVLMLAISAVVSVLSSLAALRKR